MDVRIFNNRIDAEHAPRAEQIWILSRSDFYGWRRRPWRSVYADSMSDYVGKLLSIEPQILQQLQVAC